MQSSDLRAENPDLSPPAPPLRFSPEFIASAELELRRRENENIRRAEGEPLRASLHEFSRASWSQLEPGTEFQDNWHLRVIDDHLEAVTDGRIQNLIINMPPRCMKSTKVSVQWPAWEWTRDPTRQYLTASHAEPLAIRDAFKMRTLIEGDWYQRRFGLTVQLHPDQNAKGRFMTTKNGHRIVTSVGGSAVGEGGSRRLIDDPHDPKKAMFSPAALQEVIDWWDNVMVSRLNNPKTDATVIVHQRVHEMDLTGHVTTKEPGKWQVLVIPMRYDGVRRSTCLGEYDPRTTIGELLWPQRFGEKEVEALERALGVYGTASQLQQQPAPLGGGLLKLIWFQRYATPPAVFDQIIQSWDTAQKGETANAFSVCTTWGRVAQRHYLIDVYREQVEYPALRRVAVSVAQRDRQRYGRLDTVLIEDKSSGSSLIQDLRADKEFRAPIIAIDPKDYGGDKLNRAATSSPAIEAGLTYLPETATWLPEFETEISRFPNSLHKDQVDSVSQYLNWSLGRSGGMGIYLWMKEQAEAAVAEKVAAAPSMPQVGKSNGAAGIMGAMQ